MGGFRSVKQEVQEVLDLRRSLATWIRSANGLAWMQTELEAVKTLGRSTASSGSALAIFREAVDTVTPYVVEDEMMDVAVAAASHSTFPGFSFQPEEMPTPSGLLLLPRAIPFGFTVPGKEDISVSVGGYFWHVIPGARAHDGLDRFVAWSLQVTADMPPVGALFAPPRLMPGGHVVIRFGAEGWSTGDPDDSPEDEMRLLKTIWLLMGQQLSDVKKLRGPKHEQEKAEKKGRPIPEVVVVTLRRMKTTDEYQRGGHSHREYSHRFIVDGFWRVYHNERYSERVRSTPQWISPYVKGDPEKPLVVKDKVYRLAR